MEDWRYYLAMVAAALFKVVLSKTLTFKQSAVNCRYIADTLPLQLIAPADPKLVSIIDE